MYLSCGLLAPIWCRAGVGIQDHYLKCSVRRKETRVLPPILVSGSYKYMDRRSVTLCPFFCVFP